MQICPICGKLKELVPSNNPLVPGICLDCIKENVDYKDLNQVDFFCRTYNIPFHPDKWTEIALEMKEDTVLYYIDYIKTAYPKSLYNGDSATELWSKVTKEWKKCASLNEALEKIKPIKEEFIKRMQIKWGEDYSFADYIQLENLYTNTAQSSGTTNPLTLDIIRKIAIVSVDMEKALDNKDIKAAAEFSKMHKTLIDAAGLGEMIEVGETDTISTLSELCSYIEELGFQPKYYDGVQRDIVDKTIADQQEYVRNFFNTNTGITQSYELIEQQYKDKLENEKSGKAFDEVGLDQLLDATKNGKGAFADDDDESDVDDLNDVEMVDNDYKW